MITAIILAGGNSLRFGGEIPKQFTQIAGRSLLDFSVSTFNATPSIDKIIIVVPIKFKNEIKDRVTLNQADFSALKQKLSTNIISNSLIKLDYFEVIEDESFRFVREIKHDKKYRILIAAYVGGIRLIDNMLIE